MQTQRDAQELTPGYNVEVYISTNSWVSKDRTTFNGGRNLVFEKKSYRSAES